MKTYVFYYRKDGTSIAINAKSEILAWEELASIRGNTVGWRLIEAVDNPDEQDFDEQIEEATSEGFSSGEAIDAWLHEEDCGDR